MLIVVDENIPYAETYFSHLGTVRLLPGRQMSADMVRNADLLMVRSVTPVNEALLADSRVRFVGTATAGTDHVDLGWLGDQEIGFAAAPGCNAESVAQYIAAALAWAAGRLGRTLSACSLGIVGVGQCGSRVERIARAMGMTVRLSDPPLARQTGKAIYCPLAELLDCDFLTLHVPLTLEGEDATQHLINARVLDQMKPGAVLINASRGEVVDEAALEQHLINGRLGGAIIDAWATEPNIRESLLRRVMLGTPHIAGYSLDGKVCGTRMIYEEACHYMEVPIHKVDLPLPQAPVSHIELNTESRTFDSLVSELILTAYPIGRDAGDLLVGALADPEKIGAAFDRRRKYYPLRREFAATQVTLKGVMTDWIERIKLIGFTVNR